MPAKPKATQPKLQYVGLANGKLTLHFGTQEPTAEDVPGLLDKANENLLGIGVRLTKPEMQTWEYAGRQGTHRAVRAAITPLRVAAKPRALGALEFAALRSALHPACLRHGTITLQPEWQKGVLWSYVVTGTLNLPLPRARTVHLEDRLVRVSRTPDNGYAFRLPLRGGSAHEMHAKAVAAAESVARQLGVFLTGDIPFDPELETRWQ